MFVVGVQSKYTSVDPVCESFGSGILFSAHINFLEMILNGSQELFTWYWISQYVVGRVEHDRQFIVAFGKDNVSILDKSNMLISNTTLDSADSMIGSFFFF